MIVRILARVVTYNHAENKILLVKNKGGDFWYAPGGGWEQDKENILECAKREVKEETGVDVEILRLLYLQEFHPTPETVCFETFWFAKPVGDTNINELHIDIDPNGAVGTAQWFSRSELQNVKVFPERLKNTFWENIDSTAKSEDPYMGVN